MKNPFQCTIITSHDPPILTKTFRLENGQLTKTSVAYVKTGRAQRMLFGDLTQLAAAIAELLPNQAITWGITDREIVNITTLKNVPADGSAVARSRKYFSWPAGPGILMLDHDGVPGDELTGETLRERLIEACPPLKDATMLIRPSASSGILGPDGRPLTRKGKWRILIPVLDARLIPEAGRRLVLLLWATGFGWCEVSTAGTALERTLVDAAVWQPERLDFATAPVLSDGLTRSDSGSEIHGEPDALFDLSLIQTDGSTVNAAAKSRNAARAAIKESCAAKREEWANRIAPALAERRKITEEQARAVLIRASERRVLMGHFLLKSQDGEVVSVGEILDNIDRWHNQHFADPLGDYSDDQRIATANLKSGLRPFLYSFGHGNQLFELCRQAARIQVGEGYLIDSTDMTLAVLRERGDLFDFGENAIAYVADGRARPVTRDWLVDSMGRAIDYFTVKVIVDKDGIKIGTEERAKDPSPRIAGAILAKNGQRDFRKLTAVITAPTLRRDGSIFDTPGYDEASGLLYVCQEELAPRVLPNPTIDWAVWALRELWRPFAYFPFVSDTDRGVLLQALITGCLRGSLRTAPGTGFDAPSAATGKTLLAHAVSMLATGQEPSVLAPSDSDEEIRKRLFAALRDGARVVILDNLREPLKSAALDAFLTAPSFQDRVLGESSIVSLPNRAMLIVTGNNLYIQGDTFRRILVSRLDAQTERVHLREFDFNPMDLIQANRAHFVVCALLIVRAWITAGRPRLGKGKTASFEDWDELVRQPLCWLSSIVRSMPAAADLPSFSDPVAAVETAFEQDPNTAKHAALLRAWYDSHGSTPMTVAEVLNPTPTFSVPMRDAIDAIAPSSFFKSPPHALGNWLQRHVDRVLGGLRVVRAGKGRENVARWRVEKLAV